MSGGGDGLLADYRPGQFAFVSAFGYGGPLLGSPTFRSAGRIWILRLTRLGNVTTALHELGVGDILGVRGQWETAFPWRVQREEYHRHWRRHWRRAAAPGDPANPRPASPTTGI